LPSGNPTSNIKGFETSQPKQEWQTLSKASGVKARVQLDVAIPPVDIVQDLTAELEPIKDSCIRSYIQDSQVAAMKSPISPTTRSLKQVRDELIRAAAEGKRRKDAEMELDRLERMRQSEAAAKKRAEEEEVRQARLKLEREEEERQAKLFREEIERKRRDLEIIEQAKATSRLASRMQSSTRPKPRTWEIVDEPSAEVLQKFQALPSLNLPSSPVQFDEPEEDLLSYVPPSKGESPPLPPSHSEMDIVVPISKDSASIYPDVPRVKSPLPVQVLKETYTSPQSSPIVSPRVDTLRTKPPLLKGTSRIAKELNKTIAKLDQRRNPTPPMQPSPTLQYGTFVYS
jgi:hypothetical protein